MRSWARKAMKLKLFLALLSLLLGVASTSIFFGLRSKNAETRDQITKATALASDGGFLLTAVDRLNRNQSNDARLALEMALNSKLADFSLIKSENISSVALRTLEAMKKYRQENPFAPEQYGVPTFPLSTNRLKK